MDSAVDTDIKTLKKEMEELEKRISACDDDIKNEQMIDEHMHCHYELHLLEKVKAGRDSFNSGENLHPNLKPDYKYPETPTPDELWELWAIKDPQYGWCLDYKRSSDGKFAFVKDVASPWIERTLACPEDWISIGFRCRG